MPLLLRSREGEERAMQSNRCCGVIIAATISVLFIFVNHHYDIVRAASPVSPMPAKPSSREHDMTDAEAILRAASLMEGFHRIVDPILISCKAKEAGREVVFSMSSKSGVADAAHARVQEPRQEIARIVVSDLSSSVKLMRTDPAPRSPIDRSDYAVDRAIQAAIVHLHKRGSLSPNSTLDWSRTSQGILVTVTRNPSTPGGHVSVLVGDNEARVIPGR